MFFVNRDVQGGIVAVAREQLPGYQPISPSSPELLAFFASDGEQQVFSELDADFIRVIEDLIDLLIQNNVIRMTDLPLGAQKKLLARKTVRGKGNSLLDLLGKSDVL